MPIKWRKHGKFHRGGGINLGERSDFDRVYVVFQAIRHIFTI